MNKPDHTFSRRPRGHLALMLASLLGAACSGDDVTISSPVQPPPSDPPTPIRTERSRDEGLPGLVVEIRSLAGGSGAGGNFAVGDRIRVNFTAELDDGTPVPLSELDSGSIYVSGPTFNYQRVIERLRDLNDEANKNSDGSWTYVLPPLPATYLPPYNDSPAFGPGDGELTGQPLLDGTYTVGIEAYKEYSIEGEEYRDPANVVEDFLFGGATAIELNDVVGQANCNQCHQNLQAHGGFRREVQLCVLCHTSGAEDQNDPSLAGGTPGVSIEFRVMIHKIHSGAHLPSVLGVSTDSSGNRVYDPGAAVPYQVAGRSVADFSHVTFPVFPNLVAGMPRDVGYAAAGSGSNHQQMESAILTGAATCAKCHGDPDGTGPLAAPAQGGHAYTNPSRRACGSCHDDIDWAHPYKSNNTIMPPMPNDEVCASCHGAAGTIFPTQEVHLHPLQNPAVSPGTQFNLTAVREQTQSGNGRLDRGEVVEIDVEILDGQGQPIDPSTLARIEYAVTGPTSNRNTLANDRFPPAWLSAMTPSGNTYTTTLPEPVYLERPTNFTSSGTAGEMFQTSRAPHWNVAQAETQVFVHNAVGASASLAEAASPFQNFLVLDDVSAFANGSYVVVGFATGRDEYLRVQWVDTANQRLWLASIQATYNSASGRYQPWVRNDHPAGETVQQATLVQQTAYTVDAATGTITSGAGFAPGVVVVSYVTDFAIPEQYPAAINDSPDLDETWAEWTGLDVVDGTYTVGIWGEVVFNVTAETEVTSYNAVSAPAVVDFLVGDTPTALQPAEIIASGQSCYACHDDLLFHGSHRRGYDTCTMCHGAAGSEDGPNYVWPAGAATPGVAIEFREMVHKIHMGEELANASTYAVAGFNGTPHFYDEVTFPALPGGVMQCAKCHGSSDAWQEPADRNHPTTSSARAWRVACGSCHDSSAAHAHMQSQTVPNGAESCAVCHGNSDELGVERIHRTW